LLAVVESDRPNHFRNVITGDESWFFLYYSHESIWPSHEMKCQKGSLTKINREKCLY
jgi:hypothetical protein